MRPGIRRSIAIVPETEAVLSNTTNMPKKTKLLPSTFLLALLSVGWSPLIGQSTTATPGDSKDKDSVVTLDSLEVTGLRGSLGAAAEIKLSNLQVVDSIVATDIDKLPDINASYALSRVPGVQLAHTFSGLGGNGAVTIRGLNQITNTIDGRQVITPGGIANGTAGVGTADVSGTSIGSSLKPMVPSSEARRRIWSAMNCAA